MSARYRATGCGGSTRASRFPGVVSELRHDGRLIDTYRSTAAGDGNAQLPFLEPRLILICSYTMRRRRPFRRFGRLNGIPGATASWILEDGGEPSVDDHVRLVIRDGNGQVVLDVDAAVEKGNLKAHEN